MSAGGEYPVTPAVRVLRAAGIAILAELYEYEEKGGTQRSSAELGVPERQVVKTLVMEGDAPLIVLMHGDKLVSTKNLARQLGVKAVKPLDPKAAERLTGYQVGGTSPFGTRQSLPIYVERTILELPWFLVNGGKRGFLVRITPADLTKVLAPIPVQVATDK